MKLDTSGKVDNDEESEVVEQSLYVYEMSGFKVSQDEISEDDIKADPISYFGYNIGIACKHIYACCTVYFG